MKVLRRKNLAKAIQLSLLISLPGLAAAQDAAPAPAAASPQATTLDTVTVTGSRIRQTDAVTAQPVFVLDREKLEATGQKPARPFWIAGLEGLESLPKRFTVMPVNTQQVKDYIERYCA